MIYLKITAIAISIGSILGIVFAIYSAINRIVQPTIICETEKNISEKEAVDIGIYYVLHDGQVLKDVGIAESAKLMEILKNESECCGAIFNADERPEHQDLWYVTIVTTKFKLNFEIVLFIDRCGNVIKTMKMFTPRTE